MIRHVQKRSFIWCSNKPSFNLTFFATSPCRKGLVLGHTITFSTFSLLYSKNSSLAISNIDVVKFYSNAEKDKEFIYKDNRNKCGIYCWVNLSNKKVM